MTLGQAASTPPPRQPACLPAFKAATAAPTRFRSSRGQPRPLAGHLPPPKRGQAPARRWAGVGGGQQGGKRSWQSHFRGAGRGFRYSGSEQPPRASGQQAGGAAPLQRLGRVYKCKEFNTWQFTFVMLRYICNALRPAPVKYYGGFPPSPPRLISTIHRLCYVLPASPACRPVPPPRCCKPAP